MTQAHEKKGCLKIPVQRLGETLIRRFEGIVAEGIRERSEKRRHAVLLCGLTAAGLAAALGIPAAGFVGASMHFVVVQAVLSSLCLVLAALLAGTGAYETVAGTGVAVVAMLLALGAVQSGGAASPLFWLLPIIPAEGFTFERQRLFRFSIGIASLAACLVLGAEWLDLAAPPGSPLAIAGASAAGIAYFALRGFRARRAMAAARRAETGYQTEGRLLEDMLDKAVLRFGTDGTLVDASEAARRWFGERLADDRHPFALSIVHVTDRVRYLAAFGDIRAGAASAQCEVRLSSSEGQGFVQTVLKLGAIRRTSHAEATVLVLIEDKPGGRKRAEELQAALNEARTVSDAKSSFLAMVSHELRTPLNAIIGFSDVLDQEFFGGFEDPRQKEYVGLIRQSGEHLLAVVNGLLDISKIEAGRYELVMEPFDAEDVLASVVAAIRSDADRKGIDLDIRNHCGSERPMADRRAVQQILLNLLSNAVKFTDSGAVTVTAQLRDGFFEIEVKDTGAGIAPQELPHLGKPFVQGSSGLARRYPGTGLGLSLVKGFAELHGGSMALASELGRGTTVCVRVRLDDAGLVEKQYETERRVVALKHAGTHEIHSPAFEARRSA